jgi:hypothetical protein
VQVDEVLTSRLELDRVDGEVAIGAQRNDEPAVEVRHRPTLPVDHDVVGHRIGADLSTLLAVGRVSRVLAAALPVDDVVLALDVDDGVAGAGVAVAVQRAVEAHELGEHRRRLVLSHERIEGGLVLHARGIGRDRQPGEHRLDP